MSLDPGDLVVRKLVLIQLSNEHLKTALLQ
jgi:hypothetical protein